MRHSGWSMVLDLIQDRSIDTMVSKIDQLAERVTAQGNTIDKLADVLTDVATQLTQQAAAPTAPVATPDVPIASVQTLAPNVGDVATTGAALPEAKRKTIRKHAEGDAEKGISGPAMLRHYLLGTLPKHIGKVMPDGHTYRIIDGRGEYAPSPNGPKAAFATALITHLEAGQPLPDSVVSTVPAIGATEVERGDALRKVCDTRKYGDSLRQQVLANPSVHFGTNGQMLSMVANTARSRIKAHANAS